MNTLQLPSLGERSSESAEKKPLIVDLERLMEEKYPGSTRRRRRAFPTGLSLLDERVGGGLPVAALTEVVCPPGSAGGQLLVERLLAATRHEGQYAALVDGSRSFDPRSAAPPFLEHLLWLCPQDASRALQCADVLLRDDNFFLVLLDLRRTPEWQLRRTRPTAWYRMQRLAGQTGTLAVVLTPRPLVSSCRLRVRPRSEWALEDLQQDREALAGKLDFEVLRSRQHGKAMAD